MSRLKKLATVHCHYCSNNGRQQQHPAVEGSPDDESPSGLRSADATTTGEPSACEVVSVAVRSPGPLGIIIAKHKLYTGFVYVKAFARVEASTPSELERSGKVFVGDLLVAVNRQNLVHLTKDEISDILKTDSDAEEIRVLTFLRPHSVGVASGGDSSSLSSGLGSRRCEDMPSIDMSSSSLHDQSSHSGEIAIFLCCVFILLPIYLIIKFDRNSCRSCFCPVVKLQSMADCVYDHRRTALLH